MEQQAQPRTEQQAERQTQQSMQQQVQKSGRVDAALVAGKAGVVGEAGAEPL